MNRGHRNVSSAYQTTSVNVNNPPVEIKILKQKVSEHFADFKTLLRRSVSAAWFVGEALNEIKARVHHGAWRLFLEAEGVNRETARNFMRLAREVEMTKVMSFGSVDAALKSIPAKVPSRPAADPDEPDKEAMEGIVQEAERYRADVAEAEVQTAHKEVARLTALLPDAPPAPPPDADLKRSEARLAETQTMLQTARRESMKWKRRNSAIKRDLVDGKSVDEILLQHFACVREGAETQAVLGVHGQGVKV